MKALRGAARSFALVAAVFFLGAAAVRASAQTAAGDCSSQLDPAAPAPEDAGLPPLTSAGSKLARRDYPAVFQAWTPADGLTPAESLSLHDLVVVGSGRYAKGNSKWPGLATAFSPTSHAAELQVAGGLVLAEIRYHDAKEGYLPPDHPWWLRENGERVRASKTGVQGDDWYLLDYANPCFQQQAARQCRALIASGMFDGCMLDRWAQEDDARLALLSAIRQAVGDGGILLANASQARPQRSAPLLNGLYMEPSINKPFDWNHAAETLSWAASALRAPSFTALEVWGDADDAARMRAATTMELTLSDGYVLYSRPDRPGGADHQHEWSDFWDKGLGRANGPGAPFQGAFRREFQRGTVVYNPPGNPSVSVEFTSDRRSRASGKVARVHRVASGDGDIFLKL